MPAEPPPDLAERLARRRADWRAQNPRWAARIDVARRVALWVAIPWVIFAAIVLPGGGQGIVVTAGLLWLLLQVWLLSRSKSVSWALCARTLSLSALLAWPIGVMEIGIAAVAGWSPADQASSVVIAGPVEETLKLAPLAAVIWLAANRARRMGVADHLLLGLAAGAGFQLMEDTIRRLVAAGSVSTPFQQLIQALVDIPDADADYGPLALIPGGSGARGRALRRSRRAERARGGRHRLRDHDGATRRAAHLAAPGRAVAARGVRPRRLQLRGDRGLSPHRGGRRWRGHAARLVHRACTGCGAAAPWRSRCCWCCSSRRSSPTAAPSAASRSASRRSRGRRRSGCWSARPRAGRAVWFAAMPWVRERRELAYGLDRAGDAPRRREPDPGALAERARWLRTALAGAAAAVALLLP